MKSTQPSAALSVAGVLLLSVGVLRAEDRGAPSTYRHFNVEEADGRVLSMTPVPDDTLPRWARDVSQCYQPQHLGLSARVPAPLPAIQRVGQGIESNTACTRQGGCRTPSQNPRQQT